MKKISFFLMAAGILFAALMTSCGGSGSGPGATIISRTPSDVVKASIDDLKNQKFSEVITYFVRKDGVTFTKQDTAKMTGICTMAYQQAEKKRGIKEVQIVEEKIAPDGLSATVKYKMIYNDGSENQTDASFRKVNDNWLMIIGG
jgi:hypothetical protein